MPTPNTHHHPTHLPVEPVWSKEEKAFEEDLPLVNEAADHPWERRKPVEDFQENKFWSFDVISTLLHK